MKTVGIIAVAARTPRWLAVLEADYIARLQGFRLHVRTVKPAMATKEAAAILACLPRRAAVILLDAAGKRYDSESFARRLESHWLTGAEPYFILGGASGPPPSLRQRADEMLSLSPLTFAHAVARLALVEQLFRADCIMRGHPYPK